MKKFLFRFVTVLLALFILLFGIYFIDTIKIKKEINLSDEEKREVNVDKLVQDIIKYKNGLRTYFNAKSPNYRDGIKNPDNPDFLISIPASDGSMLYGEGYSFNRYEGEFYVDSGNRRCVYKVDKNTIMISTIRNLIISLWFGYEIIIFVFMLFVLLIIFISKKWRKK